MQQWNTQPIRQSRADCIGGIPEDLYVNSYTSFVAQGAKDYLKSIDPDIWHDD